MEAFNLQYLSHHAVVLCRDHGYCLRPRGYEIHLRQLHAARGSLLKRAIEEIRDLPQLHEPQAVQNPPPGKTPIPGLTIASGLQCGIHDCGFVTPNTEGMQRHQSEQHAVGFRKTRQRIEDVTRAISYQSFFSKPFFRPFVVDNLGLSTQNLEHSPPTHSSISASRETPCSPHPHDDDGVSLEDQYVRSQQEWQGSFASFGQSIDAHENQTPPWLNTTGIAEFIRRLDLIKEEIPKLIRPEENEPEHSPASSLVQQCVLHRLTQYRRMCLAGSSKNTVNRPTLRALNTFEPNRAHTTPFTGVQELATLKKYSSNWGRLLLFLISLASSRHGVVLADLLFEHCSVLRAQVTAVSRAAGRLHTVVTEVESDFSSCLGSVNETATSQSSSSEQDPDVSIASNPRKVRARRLLHAVTKLSATLVRQEYESDAFQCSVLSFTALHVLDRHGAWMAGANYAPFLSSMIHCMQLWLLGVSVSECSNSPDPKGLQKYVETQCRRFLVNTNSCPISDLSFWRLEAWSTRKDSVRAPSTTVSPDCMQVTHYPAVLKLPAWRETLQQLVHQASCLLEEELLCGLGEAPRYPLKNLQDHFGDSTPGRSFLDVAGNGLHAAKDWLYERVHANPDLWGRFYRDGRARRSNMDVYLHANQRFLRLLAVLIYWTSGLPPRRKELIGISWCNQEFPRNLYIYYGAVVMITSYHKSQWKIGTRPIARVLAPAVGELLIQYLIFIPPWLRFLHRCMQSTPHAVTSNGPRGYLFSTPEGTWTPDEWGRYLLRQSAASLGFSITTRQWRHIAIALDRAILQGVGCQTYGVSEKFGRTPLHAVEGSDSEGDMEDNAPGAVVRQSQHVLHHQQAGHTSTTNIGSYGNSPATTLGLTDTLLAAFMAVSRQWHELCSLQSSTTVGVTVRGHKRPVSVSGPSSGVEKRLSIRSQITVRRTLWTWPALEQGMQRLLGVDAQPRSNKQREGLVLIARSRPETLLVMPTGSGKTLLYIVPTLLPMAQVTVVVCPLVAARVDLLRRCKEWKINTTVYRPGLINEQKLHAIRSLLLADVDLAVTSSFVAVVRALQDCGRLDRLVIDEAHLILTAAHYRENLGLLGVLRQVGCPIVCLTATLPPVGERELKQSLHFTQTEMLRVSSDRVNLEYCIQSVSPNLYNSSDTGSDNEALLRAAVEICQQDIQQWIKEAGSARVTARGICYVREKSLGLRLATELHAEFYHAGLTSSERDRVWLAWSDGQTSPVMVATSALGAAVDYASVRRVLHLDAPSGMVDYGQESGRAGRDGLHAVCLVLLPRRWSVSWNTGYRSDFLTEDCKQMTRYLQGRQCLRYLLTAYLDGWIDARLGVTCSKDGARCSFCARGPEKVHVTASSPRVTKRNAIVGGSSQADSEAPATVFKPGPVTDITVSRATDDTDEDDEAPSSDYGSDPMQSLISDQEQGSMLSEREEQDVYDVASNLSQAATMQSQATLSLYENRVTRWGDICIPCSFTHAVEVDDPHPDCLRVLHAESLQDLRLKVVFAKFIACWSCGQPQFICSKRGRDNCKQPDLLWHVCWTACSLDTKYGALIIHSLGGPQVDIDLDIKRKSRFLKWLGEKGSLTSLPVSNAARLMYQWLDRLEERCLIGS